VITVACLGAFCISASSPNESPVVSSVRGICKRSILMVFYHVELLSDFVLFELEDLNAASIYDVEGLAVLALLDDRLALIVPLHPEMTAQLAQLCCALKLLKEFVVLENRLDK
jgi:hypothetical protein